MTPFHTSPSQLEDHFTCPRKRYFRSVLKLRKKKEVAASIGTCVHSILERVAKDEKPFPSGWQTIKEDHGKTTVTLPKQEAEEAKSLALKTTHLVHKSKHGWQQEDRFDLNVQNIAIIHGCIDNLHLEKGIVIDYKTKGKPQYAYQTPKDLAQDIQMKVYGTRLWIKAKRQKIHHETVKLSHVYIFKTPDPSRTLTVELQADDLKHWWRTWVRKTLKEMKQHFSLNWKQVPIESRKPDACQAFGGCEFKHMCWGRQTVEQWKFVHEA